MKNYFSNHTSAIGLPSSTPTPVCRSAPGRRYLLCARRTIGVATICLLTVGASPALAQGGMGGGMGGGRGGGGMGGPGGARGGGMPGGGRSPADMIRENIENNNPLKFLLDHRKPLELTSSQRDSLEFYRDDMKDVQKPIFKALTDEMRQKGGGGGPGGAGPGGGMGRGGRGGRGESGAEPSQPGGRALPDTVKALVARLEDIQSAYNDRARAQLTESQRTMADSLHSVWLAEQRKKAESRRPGINRD